MRTKVITQPSVEPVTLTEAKTRLSIGDAHSDDNITSYIQSAREEAEEYLQRKIITQTIELPLNAFPCDRIDLPEGPVQSITSIKYIDTAYTEQTLDTGDYSLDDYHDRAVLDHDANWPSIANVDNAVKVRYVVGYGDAGTDAPEKIRQAIMLAVGHWLRFQKEAESGIGPSRMPRQFYDLLNSYRVHPI